jgi:hypothetical protein
MKINLHIERLIVEGLPADSTIKEQFSVAVQRELAQIFQGGLHEEFAPGAAFPRVRGGTITLARQTQRNRLGSSIAQAVHHAIGKPGDGPSQFPNRRPR